MTDTNDTDIFLFAAEELADCLSLGLDGASRCLLDEDITILTILKGEEYEVNGLFERHDETGHLGLCQGNGVTVADLVNPQGDD